MHFIALFFEIDRFWQFKAVILHPISKIRTTMALFDFLFGSDEQPHHSGNWTDADDWQCGEHDDHDGMYGFDSYEENDF